MHDLAVITDAQSIVPCLRTVFDRLGDLRADVVVRMGSAELRDAHRSGEPSPFPG